MRCLLRRELRGRPHRGLDAAFRGIPLKSRGLAAFLRDAKKKSICSFDFRQYALLKLAVGHGEDSEGKERSGKRRKRAVAGNSPSTAGGKLIEILAAKARQEEDLFEKIRIAHDAQNKNRVFKLAGELVRIYGAHST